MKRWRKVTKYLLASIILFASATSSLAAPLLQRPALALQEQVFTLHTAFTKPDTLQLNWHIAPGALLYKNKIKILDGETYNSLITHKDFPIDNFHSADDEEGAGFVNELSLQIPWPLQSKANKLLISYQGCSNKGYCYNPVYKQLIVDDQHIQLIDFVGDKSVFINEQSINITKLYNINKMLTRLIAYSGILTILMFFILGILLAFTPCTLPLLPITINIILGSESKTNPYRSTALISIYILSIAVCYTAIGMGTAYLGATTQAFFQAPSVIIITSCLLTVFALLQLDVLPYSVSHKILTKLHITNNIKSSSTVIGVIIMGIASVLTLTPCATPALIGILIYISQTGNPWLGGAILFSLSLGMGLPLLGMAVIGHHILPKAGMWLNTIKHLTGLTLFGMVIWLLDRILPGNIIRMLWVILMVVTTIYLGSFKLKLPRNSWQWGQKLIGLGLLCGAVLVTINNFKYKDKEETINPPKVFQEVHNITELKQALTAAKKTIKPVVLFFHAKWCTYCEELDFAFASLSKQGSLQPFTMLQVDVTNQTKEELKLMQHCKVLGLPAILFFTPIGIEKKEYRLVETLDPKELELYLNDVLGK